jgi:hypothetical protein
MATATRTQSPVGDTKVLHTKEPPPFYGFRPSRRQVPEYHHKYSKKEAALSQRAQSSRIDFGADAKRAGSRSENVGSHVYHDKTQQASFSMKTTPMMFSETYRPGRRGYADKASNPIVNEGAAEVPSTLRRRIESGPSPELQRMNEKMWKLPAERDTIHSPRRSVRQEAEVPTKVVGKRVHGTAKRASQIQDCLGSPPPSAPDSQVRVEKATPETSAHFKQMCSETQQAVQERRLWGQIFRARGQDSLRLS